MTRWQRIGLILSSALLIANIVMMTMILQNARRIDKLVDDQRIQRQAEISLEIERLQLVPCPTPGECAP